MASLKAGKTILVTGAGRGIGYDLVKTLIQEHGATVYALTKSKDKIDELVKAFPHNQLIPIQVDLADWDATERALEGIGPVHGLVNNAGVAIEEKFGEITKDGFDTLFNINVRAIICVSQIVVKKMVEHGIKGSIVNISSVSAVVAANGLLAYGATKAAVDRLTTGMAFEIGPSTGIRVNAINPTIVLTDMGIQLWSDEAKAKRVKDTIPLGRFATIQEVVKPILFLLDSEQSAMINGQCLFVDGGTTTFGVRI